MSPEFFSRAINVPKFSGDATTFQKNKERGAKESCEEIPEAQRLLETFDFEVIKGILLEKLAKVGIDESQTNFLPIERVLFFKRFGLVRPHGQFDPMANLILLNYHRLKELSPADIKTLFLRTLIHEEVHAVSKSNCVVDSYGSAVKVEVGVAQMDMSRRTAEYSCLEEGMTERFAQEVLIEYLKRTGTGEKDNQGMTVPAYDSYVQLVDIMIKRIADTQGVSAEVVWQSLLEAKFKGRNLNESELWTDLNALFPPDVMRFIREDKVAEALAFLE